MYLEAQELLKDIKKSENQWVKDEARFHNSQTHFYYRGGINGQFISVKEGLLTFGEYEGAYPHIGEAIFETWGTKQYQSDEEAFKTIFLES